MGASDPQRAPCPLPPCRHAMASVLCRSNPGLLVMRVFACGPVLGVSASSSPATGRMSHAAFRPPSRHSFAAASSPAPAQAATTERKFVARMVGCPSSRVCACCTFLVPSCCPHAAGRRSGRGTYGRPSLSRTLVQRSRHKIQVTVLKHRHWRLIGDTVTHQCLPHTLPTWILGFGIISRELPQPFAASVKAQAPGSLIQCLPYR